MENKQNRILKRTTNRKQQTEQTHRVDEVSENDQRANARCGFFQLLVCLCFVCFVLFVVELCCCVTFVAAALLRYCLLCFGVFVSLLRFGGCFVLFSTWNRLMIKCKTWSKNGRANKANTNQKHEQPRNKTTKTKNKNKSRPRISNILNISLWFFIVCGFAKSTGRHNIGWMPNQKKQTNQQKQTTKQSKPQREKQTKNN